MCGIKAGLCVVLKRVYVWYQNGFKRGIKAGLSVVFHNEGGTQDRKGQD